MKLKPLTEQDLNDLYDLYLGREYGIFFRHFPKYLNFTNFMSNFGSCIMLKHESKLSYGFVWHYPRSRLAQVGCLVLKEFQNQEVGTKLMYEIGLWLFRDYDLQTLVCTISSDDKVTNALCQKFGCELEAVHKDACFYGGRFHDENRYIYTREKYLKEQT